MNLAYHKVTDMPKLAWCAIKEKEQSNVHIYHGKGVETSSDFFVEGAWDGKFSTADFDSSYFLMGSGGKLTEGVNIIFATPNHVLERLYSISENNITYVSNSLPLILSLSGSKLEDEYLDYEKDFKTILQGIDKFKKVLPLSDNKKLQLHYYCNIVLEIDNRLTEEKKEIPENFDNFSQYLEIIKNAIRRFIKNAQSPKRKLQYGTVTTVSKGYDAAACAALAREFGCDTAVTFDDPEKYAKDSGVELAKELGYKDIITKSASAYLQNSSVIEAEFVSSGEIGTGIVFTSFENEFSNNIVFLGERGDKLWDKNKTDFNRKMRFKNEIFTGTSFTENRLRVGYCLAPLPLFAAEKWPEIHRISNSEEMEGYSIGGSYDRPIPRRILETRGIERKKFGMSKSGAGFSYKFDNLKRLKKRMSDKSFEDFSEFYENNKRFGLNVLIHWFKYLWVTKYQYLRFFLNKAGIRLRFKPLKNNATSNPGAPSYLFNWGVQKMIKRYENAGITVFDDSN